LFEADLVCVVTVTNDDGYYHYYYSYSYYYDSNFIGTQDYLDSMDWSGQQKWSKAPRNLWKVHGVVSGFSKQVDNLHFLIILNSGHLVPMDQPEAALDLLNRFTQGLSFADSTITLAAVVDEEGAPPVPDIDHPANTKQPKAQFLSFFVLLLMCSMGVLLLSFLYFLYHDRRGGYHTVHEQGMFDLETQHLPTYLNSPCYLTTIPQPITELSSSSSN